MYCNTHSHTVSVWHVGSGVENALPLVLDAAHIIVSWTMIFFFFKKKGQYAQQFCEVVGK